ncbi:low affinity iron permease family protein [Rhizorhabdus dicambivorans]|uniref:Low affinity iron permease family protein n=1 Tax=Rhizorhabdus dicambivorans TaxID=1850238 RepID=A0A2A4FV83_9SPHN|nr:low affinity iron permease family protein [Rhizorhabdus dicambivorans]ATE64757.1 low affinity iron permease family protein [Rhizorhabdus dicambivorans]PCE41301.1 low affinity iron permease family protein [Rhizorhabdus dicambivorans]
MDQFFTRIAARIASAVGQPLAFVVAFVAIILWGASGPIFGFSDTWQLIVNTTTTIITFLMVFLIQNAQNRDAAAMQAKLDEIIRAIDGARNDYIGIEHLTERQLETIRADIEQECAPVGAGLPHHTDSLGHLIRRR